MNPPKGWCVYDAEWGYLTGRRMQPDGHWLYEFGTKEQAWIFDSPEDAKRMRAQMQPLYPSAWWGETR